ncbi:uncharacterized protein LOC114669451 [Erpetoichthys calabaricus]|uniref:uncharacterized protein LOC114669451 n=1 Tax=Erpetoichthys calabaricus TaxID=27687 RepID=UPI002234DC68|nr:uncharacterized protein LOC114669451 [Erpetoichthys calabaricus]
MCQTTVSCKGVEDHCFISDDGTNLYQGCASKSICDNSSISSSYLHINLNAGIQCCQGTLCNKLGSGLTCSDCQNSYSYANCQLKLMSCAAEDSACAIVTRRTRLFNQLTPMQIIFRRYCVAPDDCSIGFSFQDNNYVFSWTLQCCTSQLCNAGPGSTTYVPNGLVCCSGSGALCQNIISCVENEDYCFTSVEGPNIYQGCASSRVCESPGNASSILQMDLSPQIQCCQGSLCNKPSSIIMCNECMSTFSWETCQDLVTACSSPSPYCTTVFSTSSLSRSCAAPESCNLSISVNYGIGSSTWISECCDSDLCNTGNVSVSYELNGMMCCVGPDNECTSTVSCSGIQDSCFTALDSDGQVLTGCASRDVCENPLIAATYLQVPFSSQISCCQGILCNKPNSSLVCNDCFSTYSWQWCQAGPSFCTSNSSTCASVLESINSNLFPYTHFWRSCVSPELCNVSASINYGHGSNMWITQCCSSDMCNSEQVNVSSDPNGLLCCVDNTCQGILLCTGIQDHCFIFDSSVDSYRGCVSASVCDSPVDVSAHLQISLDSQISCCQGTVCNKPNASLICYSCNSQSSWDDCQLNQGTLCGSEASVCATVLESQSSMWGTSNSFEKFCSTPDMCNSSVSINIGYGSTTWTSQCCTSDLCNDGNVTLNTSSSTNGLLCCAGSDETCNQVVMCTGAQDHCFTTGAGGSVFRGCCSESVCLNPVGALTTLQVPLGPQFNCCQGDLCNKPSSSLICNTCNVSTSWEACGSQISQCGSEQTTCLTSLYAVSTGAYTYSDFVQSCSTENDCNVSLSINFGSESKTWITECCSSDLCNGGTVAVPDNFNNLTCCAGTSGACDSVVNCEGIQDHCFMANNGWMMGCASESICNAQLGALIKYGLEFSQMTCCQGFLCNRPTSLLACYNCPSFTFWETCNSLQFCANSACLTSVQSIQSNGYSWTKTCAGFESCNLSASLNYGSGTMMWISECCATDLCNNNRVNVSSDANGLVCCAGTNGACEQTVDCVGLQDFCFSSASGLNTYLGCASQGVCDNLVESFLILGLPVASNITCCQGDLCNKPVTRLTCLSCYSMDSWDMCDNISMTCTISDAVCTSVMVSQAFGQQTSTSFGRFCANPMNCNTTSSFNFGNGSFIEVSNCCTSDMCNTERVNTSSSQNGLWCCSGTNGSCQSIINCTNEEDYCFTSVIGSTIYQGCASRWVCDNPSQAFAVLDPISNSQVQCCEGSLCNQPDSSIVCYTCSFGQPCIATLCQSGLTRCATMTQIYGTGEFVSIIVTKFCASPDSCNSNGSITDAYQTYTWSVQCCSSDLCLPENVSLSGPNGLVCCSDTTCQTSVNCTGFQDHCFIQGNGLYVQMGCVSNSECSLRTCCEGNFCNKPRAPLTCHSCSSSDSWDSCLSSNVSCSSADSLCASGVLSYSPGSQTYTRTCVEPTTCNTNGSLNYGYGSVTWIFKCCNTDLCNDDTVSFPNNTNSLYCCAGTDMTCQNTVNCTGLQDSCFTSANGASVYLGCSSVTICEDHNLASLLGLSATSVISCCEGNLCNQPGNASILQNALVCCTGSDISCQNTVTCANTDDFCFIYDDGWSTNTGCASSSQCEASSTPNATTPPSYSCCQGNLCNKPKPTVTCNSCYAWSSSEPCLSQPIQCSSSYSACATVVYSGE